MDFEIALWQACRSLLPSCRLHGCFFHFTQAIWRKVQELGLRPLYDNDEDARNVIRHIFGLPFLPETEIFHAFGNLYYSDTTTGELRPLFDYVLNTWVERNNWTSRDWSVYGRSRRTNNNVEGWHNRLNRKALKANLPFYALVQLLYEETQSTRVNSGFVEVGRYPASQQRKGIYRTIDRRIRHYWRRFHRGEINSMRLLSKCAGIYGHPRT